MKFEFFISSAAVTAIATVISAVISSWIARKTAESTANKEIEKMKLSWEREDLVSSDEEFAEMAAIVSKFIAYGTGAWNTDALEKVAAIRSKESGQIGSIMDQLYDSILNDRYTEADTLLSKAIHEKRRVRTSGKEC